MDFEYGCSTVNKYAFLDENEVEDPSELLAQAEAAATKKAADAKKADAKKGADSKGKKPASTQGKEAAKQPLKASDNAVKKTGDNKDGKLTEKTYLTVGDHTFWRKEVDRHHLC